MHLFTHFFTPHHTNNYRPRILHPSAMLVIAGFALTFQVISNVLHFAYPSVLGFATNIVTEDLLRYTNEERAQIGVGELTLDSQLSHAAEQKAFDMFAKGYWAHHSPDGLSPWDFITDEGYRYVYAGENLARDFTYSKDVVDAWMASQTHRENLLRGDYRDIGFAIVDGELSGQETTLVVQMFGTKRGASAAVQPKAPVQEQPIADVPRGVPAEKVAINQPSSERTIIPVAGVVKEPLIDIRSTQQSITYMLLGAFLTVLVIDGILIWRRQTIRIAGHNLAHALFLLMIVGIVVLGTSGSTSSIYAFVQ
jgi:hypothetical protein